MAPIKLEEGSIFIYKGQSYKVNLFMPCGSSLHDIMWDTSETHHVVPVTDENVVSMIAQEAKNAVVLHTSATKFIIPSGTVKVSGGVTWVEDDVGTLYKASSLSAYSREAAKGIPSYPVLNNGTEILVEGVLYRVKGMPPGRMSWRCYADRVYIAPETPYGPMTLEDVLAILAKPDDYEVRRTDVITKTVIRPVAITHDGYRFSLQYESQRWMISVPLCDVEFRRKVAT